MPIQIPTGAEREYLIIFGVAAIYVATRDQPPCMVRVSRDLGRSLTAMRKRWPGTEIASAFWVRDRATAKAIVAAVEGFVSPEAARQEIEAVAANRQVALTNHDVTMGRVRAALQQIDDRIKEANKRGDLAWFNAAFRSWRLIAKNFGRGMSYAEARARLRRAAIKQLKTLGVNDLGPSLLSDVFPPLPLGAEKIQVDGLEKRGFPSRATWAKCA
jgi:hypothetical protein